MNQSVINRNLFPYESRFITIDGHQMHYIDEGVGKTIIFVHGTPEWSFAWRDMIAELKKDHRCIAFDHLGMGLSDKPAQADYASAAHAQRMKKLIDALGLTDMVIVAYDFGGGIALDYILNNRQQVTHLCLFNTWLWSVGNDPHYSSAAKVLSTWFGRLLYKQFNFPVNFIMPRAYGDRKKLTLEIHRHFKMVLPNAASRVATYGFALDLMGGNAWREANWSRRNELADLPVRIFWGMKDQFVPNYELKRLSEGFPQAQVTELPQAGHFAQEEAGYEIAVGLRAFIG